MTGKSNTKVYRKVDDNDEVDDYDDGSQHDSTLRRRSSGSVPPVPARKIAPDNNTNALWQSTVVEKRNRSSSLEAIMAADVFFDEYEEDDASSSHKVSNMTWDCETETTATMESSLSDHSQHHDPTKAGNRSDILEGGISRCGGLCHHYWRVLLLYPNFRYYLFIEFCKNMGDWLVRIASLLIIQEWSGTGKALSHLVLCTLIPKAICAPIGGYLSDRFDRRCIMIALDSTASVLVLGYVFAIYQQSLTLLYFVTIMRSSLASAYYPVTQGLLSLLVPNVRDLQYAVTMAGWAWSLCAMIGGPTAGVAVVSFGMSASFIIDGVTYWLSALVMTFFVSGNFSVHHSTTEGANVDVDNKTEVAHSVDVATKVWSATADQEKSSSFSDSMFECFAGLRKIALYLSTCGFGLLVLLKPTGSLIWGPEDIVGVEFATVRDEHGDEIEDETSKRMGILFAFIGLGNFLGPTLIGNMISDANKPITIQRNCILSFVLSTCGWFFIAQSPTFSWFVIGSTIRTLGSGMIYVYSTLLLQTLCQKEMLGRVLSVEYTLFVLAEALSSSTSGRLFDAGVSPQGLGLLGAGIAASGVAFWSVYHFVFLRGAAAATSNPDASQGGYDLTDNVSSLELPPSPLL